MSNPSGLRPDEISAIAATINRFLPEKAQITRTGLTVSCRLNPDEREIKGGRALIGIPPFISMRRLQVTMPDNIDAVPGDTFTITASAGSVPLGTVYIVIGSKSPSSNSVATNLNAVLQSDAEMFPIITDTVTFQQSPNNHQGISPSDPGTQIANIGVTIEPLSYEWQVDNNQEDYKYRIVWRDTLIFASNKLSIRDGDFVLSNRFKTGKGTIRRPERWPLPVPLAAAYIEGV